MNRINIEFAGLALMAAAATMAGTLATLGAPLLAQTPGTALDAAMRDAGAIGTGPGKPA